MGGRAALEAHLGVNNIFNVGQNVRATPGADGLRHLLQQGEDDREVVWRQVPKDIWRPAGKVRDSGAGINVVKLAERAALDHLAHDTDRRVILERMPDHQHTLALFGDRIQLAALRACHSQRLLDERVLSGLEQRPRQFKVRLHRGGDNDPVYRRVIQYRAESRETATEGYCERTYSNLSGARINGHRQPCAAYIAADTDVFRTQ